MTIADADIRHSFPKAQQWVHHIHPLDSKREVHHGSIPTSPVVSWRCKKLVYVVAIALGKC